MSDLFFFFFFLLDCDAKPKIEDRVPKLGQNAKTHGWEFGGGPWFKTKMAM